MFKLVSLVFLYVALLALSSAQNRQSSTNEQTVILPNEVQWEYLLVRIERGDTHYDNTIYPPENVEVGNDKINHDKRFAYTRDFPNYVRRIESREFQAALDSLGKIGWELVAVVPGSGDNQDYAQFVFKRKFDAERSRREAEQQKLKQERATGKAQNQVVAKKVEFIDLDRAEIVAAQKSVEIKAASRLEQALRNLKNIPITDIKARAYFQKNAEPLTHAEIIINGSQKLLKDNNYRASEAQAYLRQAATDIFNQIGLRKSDVNNDFFAANSTYLNRNPEAPRVQIFVRLNLVAGEQSKNVATGVISGAWADVAANK